jgi:hypothetical protein
MEESGFFPSVNGNRKYKYELIANFLSKMLSNGVFNNELKVIANDNMTVTLKAGSAFINGFWFYNPSDKIINISLADNNQSRIDSIVLRYSKGNLNIISDVLEGSYASNPTAVDLTRNSNIYELRLCNITINKSIDKITNSMIEDCRFNTSDCGQVVSAVQQLDTTEIFAQYDAIFNSLFSQMQNILDGDAAGKLISDISNLRTALGINLDTYSSTATYSKGDLVVYNHVIYECNEDNVTGNWDASKWTIVPIIVNDEE